MFEFKFQQVRYQSRRNQRLSVNRSLHGGYYLLSVPAVERARFRLWRNRLDT